MSPQPARLAQNRLPQGGLIDRTKPITFFFDGKALSGPCRATRSPRRFSPTACITWRAASSITARAASSGPVREDPGALVSHRFRSGDDGGQPACHRGGTERTGSEAFPQNWLALACVSISVSVNDLMHPVFCPAGLYLQDLSWGRRWNWMVFEPFIRRAGRARPRRRAHPISARYEHIEPPFARSGHRIRPRRSRGQRREAAPYRTRG